MNWGRLLTNVAGSLLKPLLKSGTSSTSRSSARGSGSRASARRERSDTATSAPTSTGGDSGNAADTEEIAPPSADGLRITYAPHADGDPDAGEVVWAWVPYEEDDGRGKDRPVLVIGRQRSGRAYAVKLTSKSHDGQRDYLSIGSGEWDPQGRPSWVDLDQLYSIGDAGMRREGAALDAERFRLVADALRERYGWSYDGA